MVDIPYFMQNKEWYEYNYVIKCYVLTDKAPEKAKKSYRQYMLEVEKENA